MLEGQGYRPQVQTFEVAGGRFDVIEPVALLADVGGRLEPVLQPGDFPAPVTKLSLQISAGARGGSSTVRFQAQITLASTAAQRSAESKGAPGAPAEPTSQGRIHPAVVGTAYVAPLLEALSRLVSPAEPAAEAAAARVTAVQDRASEMRATLTHGNPRWDGRVTHLIDTVVEDARPEQLRAFVRIVVDVARQLVSCPNDETWLAGRAYTLSRAWDVARLDQFGGLDDVVHQLREVADSFQHPEVMARWGARRPQGVLMSGPPGTGKTTLAKALATEIGGTLKEIRTPDILDKWVGASERNIKKIFTEARRYRTPTVLLFDEFDSIISYTGAPRGAADQAINSVAGIFKQEMSTLVEENPNVIVVATTNFPDRVDESLTRSGRFDIKISVPLPDTAARAEIFTKMLRRLIIQHEINGFRMFADDIDVAEIAELTAGMSGADLKELLRRVQMTKAMQEARGSARAGAITQDDLRAVVAQLRLRSSRVR
jgi:transitional endoplasmic reticulum ATPase